MLEFWYSERCSRQIKLIVVIATCILIYAASTVAQLDPVFVGVSLAIGIVVHLLHHFRLKISKSNPYANGFSALSRVIPIIALITLFGYLPEQHERWANLPWVCNVLALPRLDYLLFQSMKAVRSVLRTDHFAVFS